MNPDRMEDWQIPRLKRTLALGMTRGRVSATSGILKLLLEIQTQGELDLSALVHSIGDLPESGNGHVDPRSCKLRVIEQIEKLRSEFERPLPSAGEAKPFANREVPVVGAILSECVEANIATTTGGEFRVEKFPPEDRCGRIGIIDAHSENSGVQDIGAIRACAIHVAKTRTIPTRV